MHIFKHHLALFLVVGIFVFILGCKDSVKEDASKEDISAENDMVEIILQTDDDGNISSNTNNYREEAMKELAVVALKEFLSLPYSPEGVWTAYEKFYSSNFKNILSNKRNIKDADSYVLSEPSVDFEFEIKIDEINDVWFEESLVFIDVNSSVMDRVNNTVIKQRQTFRMQFENNKFVISD